MLDNIENHRLKLRKSERRVADYVLAHPNQTIHSSLNALAQEIGISQPTVIRFCRAIGCQGFQDFKLSLAQSLVSRTRYFHPQVQAVTEVINPYQQSIDQKIALLNTLRNNLHSNTLDQAVGLISKAGVIHCFACDKTRSLLNHLQHQLFERGYPAMTYANDQLQLKAAQYLTKPSLILAISIDNTDKHLVQACSTSEADVISLCISDSPLKMHSRLSLNLPVSHNSDDSYFACQVLLDCLNSALPDKEN